MQGRPLLVGICLVTACVAFPASTRADCTFRIGGPERVYAWAAATSEDGGVFVAGSFAGTVDFDPGPGVADRHAAGTAQDPRRRMDAFLARYDRKGELVWVITAGGSGINLARSVAADGAGGVYVAGGFSGKVDFDASDAEDPADTLRSGAGRNAFLAHYAEDGSFLWVKGFGDEDIPPPDAGERIFEAAEGARGVAVDSEGNVYVVGMFTGRIQFDPADDLAAHYSHAGSRDIFLASFDAEGTPRWGRTWGGKGQDQGHAVAVGAKDLVVVGGLVGDDVDFHPGRRDGLVETEGGADAFLLFLSRKGAFRRVVSWGGTEDDEVSDGGIGIDRHGGVVAAGEFRHKVDFDPSHRKVRRESEGGSDVFLVRYDAKGKLDWVATAGGKQSDSAHVLAFPSGGGVAVAGRFVHEADFDPSRRKHVVEAAGRAGASDAFVALYDLEGRLKWVHALGADVSGPRNLTRAVGLAPAPGGGLTAVGVFFGAMDVDPGDAEHLLSSDGGADVFVVQYDAEGRLRP